MSVLEFIAALKWPITVLILAGTASYALRRSPTIRASLGRQIGARNWRFRVAGQEMESTLALAQVQDGMTTAAGSDDHLADELTRRYRARQQTDDPSQDQVPTSSDLEATRREAVEAVMRSASRWGWNLAHRGLQHLPDLVIDWTDDGQPEIGIEVRDVDPAAPVDLFAPALAEMTRRTQQAGQSMFRTSERMHHLNVSGPAEQRRPEAH